MSTASKRQWRAKNPERSRRTEARRAALRRRHGLVTELGKPAFSYLSGESYQRYEHSMLRIAQRAWYSLLHVAGAHRMSESEREAVLDRMDAAEWAAFEARRNT